MALSNQFLAIPPDHPLAIEFFDVVGLQWVVINQINSETALVNAGGDRTVLDRNLAALSLVDEKIKSIMQLYRDEREGDASCTVGFTHDVRGFPSVKGRPCFTLH